MEKNIQGSFSSRSGMGLESEIGVKGWNDYVWLKIFLGINFKKQ